MRARCAHGARTVQATPPQSRCCAHRAHFNGLAKFRPVTPTVSCCLVALCVQALQDSHKTWGLNTDQLWTWNVVSTLNRAQHVSHPLTLGGVLVVTVAAKSGATFPKAMPCLSTL